MFARQKWNRFLVVGVPRLTLCCAPSFGPNLDTGRWLLSASWCGECLLCSACCVYIASFSFFSTVFSCSVCFPFHLFVYFFPVCPFCHNVESVRSCLLRGVCLLWCVCCCVKFACLVALFCCGVVAAVPSLTVTGRMVVWSDDPQERLARVQINLKT